MVGTVFVLIIFHQYYCVLARDPTPSWPMELYTHMNTISHLPVHVLAGDPTPSWPMELLPQA